MRVIGFTVRDAGTFYLLRRKNRQPPPFEQFDLFQMAWIVNQPCEIAQWTSEKCLRRYIERKERDKSIS